ncbi:putative oxidoreductase [Candidatus Izimaplasma bacterium HR1]|jgi:predicted aldo/keto reductase-like oxidoreductase|uniref:aldo/keto reductase n=1 Tax=Candidatus Izimoplasma sp. HR1 TaxID=1541959 RepID=UPI0004F63F19|nr:putative oxidoreductase [Candidatus Izimaplasma bacterium HR1]
MEKREIKVNGKREQVSLLGFGCMRFPTKDGEIDTKVSKEMIYKAVENGVNYIDTAYPYHGGKSELFVKEVIQELDRNSFFLADKLPIWDCKTKEDVDRIFHEQLEKCGVEYFDFYLIHAVNKDRIEEVKNLDLFATLEKYKNEGKIRNIGFSFHDDLDAFKLWADLYDWDFVQIQLNYMDIEHQQGMEGYEILTKKGIPVIIMEPVKGGSLAKFNEKIESKLKSYNKEASIASWAFRWVASLPNVKVVLSGMSTLEQVEDNLKTFNNFIPFNEEEYKIIKEVRNDIHDLSKVECTSCNYCMPCPHGVDIPKNFRAYNNHSMYENDNYIKWVVEDMNKQSSLASFCIECGECLPKCPQFIEIPTRLIEFDGYLEEKRLKNWK